MSSRAIKSELAETIETQVHTSTLTGIMAKKSYLKYVNKIQ